MLARLRNLAVKLVLKEVALLVAGKVGLSTGCFLFGGDEL